MSSSDDDKIVQEMSDTYTEIKLKNGLSNKKMASFILMHLSCYAVYSGIPLDELVEAISTVYKQAEADYLKSLREDGRLN